MRYRDEGTASQHTHVKPESQTGSSWITIPFLSTFLSLLSRISLSVNLTGCSACTIRYCCLPFLWFDRKFCGHARASYCALTRGVSSETRLSPLHGHNVHDYVAPNEMKKNVKCMSVVSAMTRCFLANYWKEKISDFGHFQIFVFRKHSLSLSLSVIPISSLYVTHILSTHAHSHTHTHNHHHHQHYHRLHHHHIDHHGHCR